MDCKKFLDSCGLFDFESKNGGGAKEGRTPDLLHAMQAPSLSNTLFFFCLNSKYKNILLLPFLTFHLRVPKMYRKRHLKHSLDSLCPF